MDHAQLTRKQRKFFNFIVEYKKENNIWPTYREIADRFKYKSPNSVTQNIKALLKKGYLIKSNEEEYDINREIFQDEEEPTYGGIPVKGIITAGYLQEAVEADLGTITLEKLFPNLDKMFALRVSGMSMRDVGIFDGDFVLLVDKDVSDGDIGAVLYNGETSLKRIYFDKDGLRLEPANEEYNAISIEPDVFEEVKILGRYVGHVNRTGIHRVN
ncbi:MAG TPA: transcriptional repressor LexA [Balneolales bacterium]|nr:transcriptional repressor LexA [Balneolales bacterium]